MHVIVQLTKNTSWNGLSLKFYKYSHSGLKAMDTIHDTGCHCKINIIIHICIALIP